MERISTKKKKKKENEIKSTPNFKLVVKSKLLLSNSELSYF